MSEPMNAESQNIAHTPTNSKFPKPIIVLIVAIILGSLFIGMGIIGAGWLISKEIALSKSTTLNSTEIATSNKVDVNIPNDIQAIGAQDARVTIIEFADYNCPYCLEWHTDIFPKLKEQYIDTGKARFIYWDFAFLSDDSIKAAEAASCAADQNKFWEYHNALFEHSSKLNKSNTSRGRLLAIAQDLQMDETQFAKCFDQGKYSQKILDHFETASGAGISSTPTLLINGYKLEGVKTWDVYRQIIDSQLQ